MQNKIIKSIGSILVILAFYYLIKSIIILDIDFYKYLSDKHFIIISILLINIIVGVIYLNSYIYTSILTFVSKTEIKKVDIYNIYITSNIGKYLPGNIMHLVGRNLIGAKYNIDQKYISISTIIEIFLTVLSCSSLSIITGLSNIILSLKWLFQNYKGYLSLIFISVIGIGLILTAVLKRKRISYFKEIFTKENMPLMVRVLFIDILVFSLTAVTYVTIVLYTVNAELAASQIFMILSVYLISWLFGFLTPGAPGGIGIREAILILLLGNFLPEKLIVTATVVHRCITIIGDFLAFISLRAYFLYLNIIKKGALK